MLTLSTRYAAISAETPNDGHQPPADAGDDGTYGPYELRANLSSGGGNLITATIGRPYQDNTNNECYGNLCAEMGIPCQCDEFSTEPMKALNQQLLALTHHLTHPHPITTTLGNDKGKDDDGQKDGPHHDITAGGGSGDACYCNQYYGVKCGNCA